MVLPVMNFAISSIPRVYMAPDFSGETFRILKEREERGYGEYLTRLLVLEACDRLKAKSSDIPSQRIDQLHHVLKIF